MYKAKYLFPSVAHLIPIVANDWLFDEISLPI